MRGIQYLLIALLLVTKVVYSIDIWSVTHENGSLQLSANHEIFVRYWPPIDTATVSGGVTIHGSIQGNYTFLTEAGENGFELQFITLLPFQPGETITVTLGTSLAGLPEYGGSFLDEEYVFSFTVSEAAGTDSKRWDYFWPTIVSIGDLQGLSAPAAISQDLTLYLNNKT